MRLDYFVVAEKLVCERFPQAACSFVTGSLVTGDHTPQSDIDLVILYNDEVSETYRESLIYEGWPVELFVHNLKSQEYFFGKDCSGGSCTMPDMIAKSRVIGPNLKLAESRKEHAHEWIAKGPPALTVDQLRFKCYMITDKWDDLVQPKDPEESLGTLAVLFTELADFHLRANGKWSGTGKQLVRLLKKDNPEFAQSFIAAFSHAYQGSLEPLRTVITTILAPFGGFLFEGYKAIAPREKWDR